MTIYLIPTALFPELCTIEASVIGVVEGDTGYSIMEGVSPEYAVMVNERRGHTRAHLRAALLCSVFGCWSNYACLVHEELIAMRPLYEISGCYETREEIVGPVPDDQAEFFGVYQRDEDDLARWVEDYPSRQAAELAVLYMGGRTE